MEFQQNAPVYGNFFELLELHAKLDGPKVEPPLRVNHNSGYYCARLGRFFPYPVP